MATRNDVRVVKTRQKLRSALLMVLEKKRIEDLSIAEVCRAAGVNRNTFYSHYDDLCELLEEVKSTYLKYFINQLSEYRKKSTGMDAMLTYLLELIDENRFFFSVIFSDESVLIFLRSLIKYPLEDILNDNSVRDRDAAAFVEGGVSSMIDLWFKCPGDITAEEEAGRICSLIDKITVTIHTLLNHK